VVRDERHRLWTSARRLAMMPILETTRTYSVPFGPLHGEPSVRREVRRMHERRPIRGQVYGASRAQHHMRHRSGAALHSQLYRDRHAALQRIPERRPGSQRASSRRPGVRKLHERLLSRLPESRLVFATNCARPNPRLRPILEARGFVVRRGPRTRLLLLPVETRRYLVTIRIPVRTLANLPMKRTGLRPPGVAPFKPDRSSRLRFRFCTPSGTSISRLDEAVLRCSRRTTPRGVA